MSSSRRPVSTSSSQTSWRSLRLCRGLSSCLERAPLDSGAVPRHGLSHCGYPRERLPEPASGGQFVSVFSFILHLYRVSGGTILRTLLASYNVCSATWGLQEPRLEEYKVGRTEQACPYGGEALRPRLDNPTRKDMVQHTFVERYRTGPWTRQKRQNSRGTIPNIFPPWGPRGGMRGNRTARGRLFATRDQH